MHRANLVDLFVTFFCDNFFHDFSIAFHQPSNETHTLYQKYSTVGITASQQQTVYIDLEIGDMYSVWSAVIKFTVAVIFPSVL